MDIDQIWEAWLNAIDHFFRPMKIMLAPPSHEIQIPKSSRAPWRQRLVDAETGFRLGLRTDSILFVYVLISCMVIASGLVLGIHPIEWAILVLSLGLTLSVELFHQLLRFIVEEFRHQLRKDISLMMRLGTAAVVTTNVTAISVILIILGTRFFKLFS